MLKALTGREWNIKELKSRANKVRTMIRIFNIKAGMRPEIDDMLPFKILEEPLKLRDGKEYRITKEEMRQMLKYYYKCRGWDEYEYPKEIKLSR